MTFPNKNEELLLYILIPISLFTLLTIFYYIYKYLKQLISKSKPEKNLSEVNITSLLNTTSREPLINKYQRRDFKSYTCKSPSNSSDDSTDPSQGDDTKNFSFGSDENSHLLSKPAISLNLRHGADQLKNISKRIEDNPIDTSVLDMFTSVLTDGLVINLHTIKCVKQIKIFILHNELHWKSLVSKLKRKTHKIDLSDIINVTPGKLTNIFKSKISISADDNSCFSLHLTNESTLDFEACNKVERDVLLYGFAQRLKIH